VELWRPMGWTRPEDMAALARRSEADGWDGLMVSDTQCLQADPFVMLTLAATATARLQLSISTSNPVTRHPAVAASAIASVAAVAGPRVYYGVGRGDSALAYVGGAPASVARFERYVEAVARYLRRQPVSFESIAPWRLSADVTTLELGEAPATSTIGWLTDDDPVVPVHVFATGPKVIAVGGRHADRVSLGIGADVARVRWAVDLALSARKDAGLDPGSLSLGTIVPIGVADDLARARRSIANMVASEGRFSVMAGAVVGPVSDEQRRVYEAIAASYDMTHHGGAGAQVAVLTDEFIDSFAIVGPPSRCIERIVELAELGIDHVMLAAPQGDASADDQREGYRRLVDEVIPGVRDALGPRSAGGPSGPLSGER
jgi:5,10-methylenetetrahydromethanopterin reductase